MSYVVRLAVVAQESNLLAGHNLQHRVIGEALQGLNKKGGRDSQQHLQRDDAHLKP